MQKLKGSEGPQKPSATLSKGTRHLRNSSFDSDPLQRRPITERSPRFGDHHFPKGTQSNPPLHQKKLGTRITDLETQLIQAQHELKSLKHQLASAESERKKAQEELHNKGSKKLTSTQKIISQNKPSAVTVIRKPNSRDKRTYEVSKDVHWEADVFEVPVEKTFVEPKVESGHRPVEEDLKDTKSQDSSITEEQEKERLYDEATSNSEEIEMRALLEEKNKEMQILSEETKTLKKLLDEAKSEIGLARSKEEEMALKVSQLGEDLEVSLAKEAQLKEKLSETEVAKEELENEMKRMKVQTEQWKKAVDAAASVLAGGVDMKGRISERCASMDNHFNNIFEDPLITEFGGYLESKTGDHDDNFGGGKKKGSGIKMLGDLWKKKGQK